MTYNELNLKIEKEEGHIMSIQKDLEELVEKRNILKVKGTTPDYNTFYKQWFLINNSYVRIDDFIIEEYIDEDDPENPIKYKVTKVHGIGFRSESPGFILNVDSWFDISDIGTINTPSIDTLNNIYNVRSN